MPDRDRDPPAAGWLPNCGISLSPAALLLRWGLRSRLRFWWPLLTRENRAQRKGSAGSCRPLRISSELRKPRRRGRTSRPATSQRPRSSCVSRLRAAPPQRLPSPCASTCVSPGCTRARRARLCFISRSCSISFPANSAFSWPWPSVSTGSEPEKTSPNSASPILGSPLYSSQC